MELSRALPSLTIPKGPGELTPEWLSAALRSTGLLEGARVTGFTSEVVSEGEGFLGIVVRLRLELDPPEAQPPATVVGKFPISVAQNKALGEMSGAYEREIRFYRELAERVPIRTPRCYYADLDPNPLAGREEQAARFLERWPDWLIRLALPVLQWLSARSQRRYVLLLEDLAPARVGDQVAGCTPDEAAAALRALATVHAAFWGEVDVPELSWLPRIDMIVNWFQVLYRKRWRLFVERFGGKLPPQMTELAGWLEAHGIDVIRNLAALPRTLLHGDYRLDNLCLTDRPGAGVGIAAFDWQSPTRGPGAYDVAYFLPGSLRAEDAARCERDLLRTYHAELLERGVRDHSFEECERAYALAKLAIAWRFIMGIDLIDFQSERGFALIDTWLARQAALLPTQYDSLLDLPQPRVAGYRPLFRRPMLM